MTNNKTKELNRILNIISKKFVKLTPYLTILSGIMVWSYLNSIDRLDLLTDSFSISFGLISLLISAAILSLAIVTTLIIPSSILILHYSMFPDIIKKPISIPWLGWGCSILFLMLVFLPHIPSIKGIITPPSTLLVIGAMIILSFFTFILTSLFKGEFKKKNFLIKTKIISEMVFNTFTVVFSALSISIPISLLLKNSTGEQTISLIMILAFTIAFSLLSFLPAIVYFNDKKNTPSSSENTSIIPLAKKLSVTLIIAVIITSLLFPNITTILVNSSLYSIGIIDNKNHHFLINGEKYQSNMFPQDIWMTSSQKNIEKDFFIYGIRMFSAGNNNLICPSNVGEFKKNISGQNYDLIFSSKDESYARKLKDITKTCVVLLSDDAKQWDTFFEIRNDK